MSKFLIIAAAFINCLAAVASGDWPWLVFCMLVSAFIILIVVAVSGDRQELGEDGGDPRW